MTAPPFAAARVVAVERGYCGVRPHTIAPMRPYVQLVIHWCLDVLIVGTLIAVYDDIALRVLVLAVGIAYGLYETSWLRGVYRIAPTPAEFVAERPYWKTMALVYGFSLSALAIGMLTVGEGFSRYVGEHLGAFFAALVAPFAVFLAAHQAAVFQALRGREV